MEPENLESKPNAAKYFPTGAKNTNADRRMSMGFSVSLFSDSDLRRIKKCLFQLL